MGEDQLRYKTGEPGGFNTINPVALEEVAAGRAFPPSSFHPSCAVEVKLRLSEDDAVSFYRILAQEWTYADIDSPEAEVFWRLLGAFEAAGVKGLVAKAQKRAGGHRLDE